MRFFKDYELFSFKFVFFFYLKFILVEEDFFGFEMWGLFYFLVFIIELNKLINRVSIYIFWILFKCYYLLSNKVLRFGSEVNFFGFFV